VLLGLWLLALAAPGQEITGDVTLNTEPPGVQVWEVTDLGPRQIGFSNQVMKQLTRSDNTMIIFCYPPDQPGPDRPQFQLRMSEAVRVPLYPPRAYPVKLSEAAERQYREDRYLRRLRAAAPAVGLVVLVVVVGVYVRVLVPRNERLRREALRSSRWRALQPLDRSDPQVGRRIGAFRLVQRLGAGGMAAVYRALPDDTLDGEQAVALKVIHLSAATPETEQRFRQEAAVCARLDHPNLVRILDAGDQDGQLYLAMELVQGRTLRSELRPGGVSVERAREIFRAIFAGLRVAHEQEVVHRDLKPDNVMLADDGRVVVMDFGLARRHDLARITATGAVLGTPAYMAPEQIRGEETTPRTDQYALGVMLYELLTGRLPFDDGLDQLQLLMKHLSDEPRPLEGFCPRLQAAVMRMLAKSPAERFPDLQAAGEQLF